MNTHYATALVILLTQIGLLLCQESAIDPNVPMDIRNPNLYPQDPRNLNLDRLEEYEKWHDRRASEGWWHLLPYGPMYYDADIGNKPWNDVQIDLDFDYPFYGFRFNYTIIYPNGLVAFSVPHFIQPPYTFPNPKWPEQADASFIATFYAAQQFQYVGERGVSHVWYRTVLRPRAYEGVDERGNRHFNRPQEQQWARTEDDRNGKYKWGRVEDPILLDNITQTIQQGIIGANGFRADYALIVTWERMGYGGAPKVTEIERYSEVKKWLNTYQMVIATDEIRSYVIMNYGHINWTSSNSAGALRGRGGKQSAMVGFNAGNGTGWTSLPYSGEGGVYKLQYFSNVGRPGRWIYRVDEQIIPGGCSNDSVGTMYTAPTAASMLGGITVNVSGPCYRSGDVIKVIFDEFKVDCLKLNSIRAQCVLPVDRMYKTGLVNTKLSRDGGQSYPYHGTFYLLEPAVASPQIKLIDDPQNPINKWRSPNATDLLLEWAPLNLTGDPNELIDISLMGYWEDTDDHEFREIGVLAKNQPNNGHYSFNPRSLPDSQLLEAWRRFSFGVVRISLSNKPYSGVFWSKLTPFGWFFREKWEYEYGEQWALDICQEWFSYDGKRPNFIMDLEPIASCPCTLNQALLDLGRFTAMYGCDRDGDASCEYYKGAQHCVMSVTSSWTGAGQVCCYDIEGWLMHSDDYENAAYLRFYSPGVPQRAHPLGSYPYKRPPYVPSLSNFHTDIMAYEFCCKWAGHCEFYFWRRQSSGCQEYKPPAAGFAYGEPHYVTFDGSKYSFQGKGYYILTMAKDPRHDLMIQIRLEQPPKTVWNAHVNATVITGVAVRENQSDVVQILARKEFRRWRYRTDVLVGGIERYFDTPEMKMQRFKGVTLRSPERNHNQSEIIIMLDSGVGVKVGEAYGILDVLVLLPPHYNETYSDYHYGFSKPVDPESERRGKQRFVTMGLLGTMNNRKEDDLTTPAGNVITVSYPPTPADNRRSYYDFGEKWRLDRTPYTVLFQDRIKPIYNPLLFTDDTYMPVFDAAVVARNTTLILSREEIKVACQGVYECQYDFFLTGRREIALNTLDIRGKLNGLKEKGSKPYLSCGALLKAEGAVKQPPGNNYLDGVTVTFTCKPEYFLHGTQQRTCINGTWSPGWHVWCRCKSCSTVTKYECYRKCISKYILETCHCMPLFSAEPYHNMVPCSIDHYEKCWKKSKCNYKQCPNQCNQQIYSFDHISWSDDFYSNDSMRLRLEERITWYPVFKELYSMSLTGFWASLGGVFDFWIGASVISAVHLVVYITKQLIYASQERTKTGSNVRNLLKGLQTNVDDQNQMINLLTLGIRQRSFEDNRRSCGRMPGNLEEIEILKEQMAWEVNKVTEKFAKQQADKALEMKTIADQQENIKQQSNEDIGRKVPEIEILTGQMEELKKITNEQRRQIDFLQENTTQEMKKINEQEENMAQQNGFLKHFGKQMEKMFELVEGQGKKK